MALATPAFGQSFPTVEEVLFDREIPVLGNPEGDVTVVEYSELGSNCHQTGSCYLIPLFCLLTSCPIRFIHPFMRRARCLRLAIATKRRSAPDGDTGASAQGGGGGRPRRGRARSIRPLRRLQGGYGPDRRNPRPQHGPGQRFRLRRRSRLHHRDPDLPRRDGQAGTASGHSHGPRELRLSA
ncbi:hypothetical protein C7I85_24035 [Mesorhizobium soli]|uniref:Uncharacterized protein n=1 Tax=Pseudaminobacter soli (ex Li et al. 2025) TaxID=1295366 RepID=A0A2P7S2F7_9HYPH|nr:hypothetical protein C7I85_24035 [Mesorhizobium soli]